MASRTVAGIVGGQGEILATENNYNVDHFATGHYTIDFETAFSFRVLAVVVTQVPNFDGSTLDNATIMSIDNERIKVKTGDGNGDASDRPFSFIVLGD
jgi:hypothetical protein